MISHNTRFFTCTGLAASGAGAADLTMVPSPGGPGIDGAASCWAAACKKVATLQVWQHTGVTGLAAATAAIVGAPCAALPHLVAGCRRRKCSPALYALTCRQRQLFNTLQHKGVILHLLLACKPVKDSQMAHQIL